MSDNNDDLAGWGGSTGFALADSDVTIIEAEFGYDSRMGENPVLKITFEVEDSPEPAMQMYSVGSHWVVKESGAALRHESGDDSKAINNKTNYFAFFDAAASIPDARKHFITNGGTPYDTSTWIGTRWHMKEIEIPGRRNQKTGDPETKTLIVPGTFLGVVESGAKAAPAAKATATTTVKATAKKAAPKGAKPSLESLIPDEDLRNTLLEELNTILADSTIPTPKKHDRFTATAFEYEGVDGVSEIETVVMAHDENSFFGQVSAAFGK